MTKLADRWLPGVPPWNRCNAPLHAAHLEREPTVRVNAHEEEGLDAHDGLCRVKRKKLQKANVNVHIAGVNQKPPRGDPR
ncbi:hypothetical protein WMF11_23115 [Sorangium sp. So ce295]|uniref:hypothetical protein n=1 Tax=Sorangium sp. So ce295 TaxID=3133295 RepID=UPI003F62DE55